jgi:fibronectin type 3 domain-containing protein
LAWAASDNAAWLTLSPPSGTNSGTVTANVNLTGLAAGTYNAIITVTASGSTNSPVQIPVSLTLSTTTTNAASLIWNANTDTNLAGYNVYQATSSGAYTTPVATVPKPATSYTVTGLKTGTTYFFVITAYNSAGVESLLSNEVSKSIY